MSSTCRVGLISDTHGLVRDEAATALKGCSHILHAGDIDRPEVLERLRRIAPVTAVRGNNDSASWAAKLSGTAVLEADGVRIYVLHDLKALDVDPASEGFHAVVAGHSHKPVEQRRDGVLYVNPGSAGPRRFRLPVSVGKLVIRPSGIDCQLIGL